MSLYYNKLHEGEGQAPGAGQVGARRNGRAEPARRGRPKPASARTRVRRRAGRGRYDRDTIDPILDEALIGHVAFVSREHPYAIPMLYARAGDELYLHGSPLSRLVGLAVDGIRLCLTATLIDGLVLARSAFHHSINYRSVVVLGQGRAVREPGEKEEALRILVERVMPGRARDARGPSVAELQATEVVAMNIEEASAKIRTGPPIDASEDYDLPVWAGEVPLRLTAAEPIPDPRCTVPLPEYLSGYARA
jgi:nitroimidazol reductase NimA-like FMN-containing flavoprotein (pyridoxamine 5'-phosphate oxidase superfamily)